MSLTTPTTAEINANIIAQLEATLNQTIPLLPKSFLRVLSKVLAGVFILLYKYGGFIHLQQFVSTATYDETEINGKIVRPLQEWGRLFGVSDLIEATQAEHTIGVIVTNQVGQLDAGTQLIGTTNGVTYITIGTVLLDDATVSVTVRAVADQSGGDGSGTIGNLDNGATMSFANALANVDRTATVTAQTVTGADAETVDSYRQRIINTVSARPQGGAYADYRVWGSETAGIANIYPYTSDCPGQVDVYVEATPESSGNDDGIPTSTQLQAVLNLIELDVNGLASRRPANALVNTFPITRTPFDVRVTTLQVDNLAQVQQDITTALTEYFLTREPYIIGLSVPPARNRITSTSVASIVEDIVSAAGGVFGGVIISANGIETGAYTLGIGEKSKLDTVVFV